MDRMSVMIWKYAVYCICLCDQDEGTELISLTTFTKVYNPYQNGVREKEFLASERLVFGISFVRFLPSREI